MQEHGTISSLVRRWWLVLAAALVVSAVAVAAGSLRPEKHEATANFYIKESLLAASGTLGVPDAAYQSGQDWHALVAPLSSGEIVSIAAADSGVPVEDIEEFLKDDFQVTTDEWSHVTTLRVTARGTAAQANAFVTSMLGQLETTLTAQYTETLDTRIAATEMELEKAWTGVRVLPGGSGATVEFPVSGGTDAYSALLQQAAELRIARSSLESPVVMLTPAHAKRVQPSPLRDLIAGLAIGLLAGIAVALLLDARDRRRELGSA